MTITDYQDGQVLDVKKGTSAANAKVVESYTYDSAGRQATVSDITASGTMATTTYGYDDAGNLTENEAPTADGSAGVSTISMSFEDALGAPSTRPSTPPRAPRIPCWPARGPITTAARERNPRMSSTACPPPASPSTAWTSPTSAPP